MTIERKLSPNHEAPYERGAIDGLVKAGAVRQAEGEIKGGTA